LRTILYIQELARRVAGSPNIDVIVAAVSRFDTLAYQRWYDMRAGRIEVVTRAVQVRGQQEDRIEAVLLPVTLRLHQHHLLRQSVGRVGLFRITVPQILFAERHG